MHLMLASRSWCLFVAAVLLGVFCTSECLAQRPTTIVVLGDGAAAEREGAAKPWPERLSKSPFIDLPKVTNLAAIGQTFAQAREAFARHCTSKAVDIVALQYGVDAVIRESGTVLAPAEFAQQLSELVKFIKSSQPSVHVLLLTPNPLVGKHSNEEHADAVRKLAQSLPAPLIDLHSLFARRNRFPGHSAADWLENAHYPNAQGQSAVEHLVARAIACPEAYVPGAAHDARTEFVDPLRWPGRPDYSIPVLDVSAARERQTIVDREPGQYLGHPTTVLLEDGRTMLAVYPQGHGRGAIVLKRSSDGGRTWSERLPTPSSWKTSQETPTIHRVVDASGKRRLVLFSGLYPIRSSISEDDGQSWTELAPIGSFGGIVAMSSVVETKTPGRYLALFHDDGRFFQAEAPHPSTPQFTVYQSESTDGGLSWSAPRAIVASQWHLCEPGVVRSPDGKTLAMLLRENRRVANSQICFSLDEGATWSAPRPLPAALTGDRHVGRLAPDGRLVITFRDRTLLSPTWGDWVAWVGTWDDLMRGTQGQYRVRLMDNQQDSDCAYPGLELLPDGSFVTTTYGHWEKGQAPYIVCVRFKLEELDALHRESAERR